MSIAVLIATYGEEKWAELAKSRALPSVGDHMPVYAFHARWEGANLADARNMAAEQTEEEWLCFLDADDKLEAGYLDAMTAAIDGGEGPRLLVPQVQYVRPACCGKFRYDRPYFPKVAGMEHRRHDCGAECMTEGNWMVIGTLIQRELFWEVGGFEPWPLYEDWALFARAVKAGAVPQRVPDAIYQGFRSPHSRNHQGTRIARATHSDIRRAVFPELYEEVTS